MGPTAVEVTAEDRTSTLCRRPAAAARRSALVLVAVATVLGVTVAAASDATPAGAASDAGVAASGAATWPEVPVGTYRPPVRARVIDPFRAPATPWGPGNRGLEYQTVPGTPVLAIGGGQVVFAGQVGGRLAVTVLHPDGRRSSYSDLASVAVELGDLLVRGRVVGDAGPTLHLGLREGDRYVDPARFLWDSRRAVLVPVRFGAGATGS